MNDVDIRLTRNRNDRLIRLSQNGWIKSSVEDARL